MMTKVSNERLDQMQQRYSARPDDYVPAVSCSEVVFMATELLNTRAELSNLTELLNTRARNADEHRCFICDEPFKAGQLVLPSEDGLGHRACFGEDRDGYVQDIGSMEPLGPNDPIPAGEPYDPAEYFPARNAEPVAAPQAETAPDVVIEAVKGEGFDSRVGGFSHIWVGDKKYTAAQVRAALRRPVLVTDEMVDRAYEAWNGYRPSQEDVSGYGAMRAALTAAVGGGE